MKVYSEHLGFLFLTRISTANESEFENSRALGGRRARNGKLGEFSQWILSFLRFFFLCFS